MGFFLREAWDEFRAGMKGGVVPMIYALLVGYLLLVLSKADYLRDMGAVDIPRNAPSLVYLMTSGDTFFLFFAWAWVFAQPIVRDRAACLHEVVLASPVPLRQLLGARYVGALGVALVIGSSQIAGFVLAPLLEGIGVVPAGSFAPAPWLAFAWASAIYTLPLAAGAGALYFIAAMRSRGVGGPFAVAAALMACWMVAMIVLKEGHIDQFYATVLDPSGFAETEHQVVDRWTPEEKRGALLALTPAFVVNRLIWGGIPLVLLAVVLGRVRREWLVLERAPAHSSAPLRTAHSGNRTARLPLIAGPVGAVAWWRAAGSESAWQMRQVLNRRWMWAAWPLLVLLGVAAAFAHGIQHAWGPMVPRPEFAVPVVSTTFFLIIVFMTAGLTGLAARRDEQPGIEEMLDAAPAPVSVRLVGRAGAAIAITTLLALIPAASGIVTAGLMAPQSLTLLTLLTPFAHQLAVLAPALLEVAALTILLHALIRRPGPAYAASVLAAFIMIVNHEAALVTYPPFQIGLPVHIAWSGLTGLAPWAGKLVVSDGFKLSLVLLLLALSAMLVRRGTDAGWRVRWSAFRSRVTGGAGVTALAALFALYGCTQILHQRYVVDGGYETTEEQMAGNAAWETRWLARRGAFSVAGGSVDLQVDPVRRLLTGVWRLSGVRAAGGTLHAELPHGLRLSTARVQGRAEQAAIENDHLALPVGECPDEGCAVELAWSLQAAGWDAEHRPPWLLADGYWLHAPEVMPRLGFNPDRVLRAPYDRARFGLPADVALPEYHAALPSGAVAPAGRWTWRISVAGGDSRSGETSGLLDFADAQAGAYVRSEYGSGSGRLAVLHDASRQASAALVAADVESMRACVARRLGQVPAIDTVAQWPRELGASTVSGGWLLLAEAPHWDVAENEDGRGTGRRVRRAEIAAALARRVVLDAADLRQGEGATWLAEGLPGAIGLLCVADTDGIAALEALLSRAADRVSSSLATSRVPVGPLAQALADGWAADYAPQAALDWAARQEAGQLAALLRAVRENGNVAGALRASAGTETTALFLGPPNASDVSVAEGAGKPRVSGRRWSWQGGGWQPGAGEAEPRAHRRTELSPPPATGAGGVAGVIYLDGWASYERSPGDNLPAAATGR